MPYRNGIGSFGDRLPRAAAWLMENSHDAAHRENPAVPAPDRRTGDTPRRHVRRTCRLIYFPCTPGYLVDRYKFPGPARSPDRGPALPDHGFPERNNDHSPVHDTVADRPA